MKFIKKYIVDAMILSGFLLLNANYYFKFTKYSVISISDEMVLGLLTVEYDYIGFIASTIIIIGFYIGIRQYIKK